LSQYFIAIPSTEGLPLKPLQSQRHYINNQKSSDDDQIASRVAMKAGLAAQQVFLFPNISNLPNQSDILTEIISQFFIQLSHMAFDHLKFEH
jgi:hypothetical protein